MEDLKDEEETLSSVHDNERKENNLERFVFSFYVKINQSRPH